MQEAKPTPEITFRSKLLNRWTTWLENLRKNKPGRRDFLRLTGFAAATALVPPGDFPRRPETEMSPEFRHLFQLFKDEVSKGSIPLPTDFTVEQLLDSLPSFVINQTAILDPGYGGFETTSPLKLPDSLGLETMILGFFQNLDLVEFTKRTNEETGGTDFHFTVSSGIGIFGIGRSFYDIYSMTFDFGSLNNRPQGERVSVVIRYLDIDTLSGLTNGHKYIEAFQRLIPSETELTQARLDQRLPVLCYLNPSATSLQELLVPVALPKTFRVVESFGD